MPDFVYEFTVPADTEQETPQVDHVQLVRGTLTKVTMIWPPGPARLVKVQILDGNVPVLPDFVNQAYAFDNQLFERELSHDIVDAPYQLTLRGWSDDTRYTHTIGVIFSVTYESDLQPGWLKELLGVSGA